MIYSPYLYRLVSPYETKHCVLERVSEKKDHAIIAIYDMHHDFNEQLLPTRLQGLNPEAEYKIEEICLMPGEKSNYVFDGKFFSGDYLMKIGLNLIGGKDMDSHIVELTQI